MESKRYDKLILREAAGCFWLVDTGQSGRPYYPPLRLNDSAAEIFKALAEGLSAEETAEKIAGGGSGVTTEEALADIRMFIDQLDSELSKRKDL